MLGPGLKQLGRELSLKPSGGRLCGIIDGFPAALWEGMGYKALTIHLGQLEKSVPEGGIDLEQMLAKPRGAYRITQYALNGPFLAVVFYDNIGTMKRIREYIKTELPALRNAGFAGAAHCSHCGEAMGGEEPTLLMLGENPIAVHGRCAGEAEAHLGQVMDEVDRKALAGETDAPRSSPLAPFGALLGGVVGALPWMILTMLGYVASLAAVLIALGANYGYKLFGGLPGKKRMALVIALTILLVPLAHVAGTIGQLAYELHNGTLQEAWGVPREALSALDAPQLFLETIVDPEGRATLMDAFAKDFGVAYLFTALGLWAVWGKLSRENLKPKRPKMSRVP